MTQAGRHEASSDPRLRRQGIDCDDNGVRKRMQEVAVTNQDGSDRIRIDAKTGHPWPSGLPTSACQWTDVARGGNVCRGIEQVRHDKGDAMQPSRHLLAALSLLLVTAPASATCWLLKNGQTLTTSANSTSPVAGAKQVACPGAPPLAKLPTPPKLGVVTKSLGKGPNSDNCVLYARSRVPTLPTGMLDWKGKLAAVNARTPAAGSVAMIPYGQVGHVAYVESVTGNTITIIEANFSFGNMTRRISTGSSLADAASRLHIAGYYRP